MVINKFQFVDKFIEEYGERLNEELRKTRQSYKFDISNPKHLEGLKVVIDSIFEFNKYQVKDFKYMGRRSGIRLPNIATHKVSMPKLMGFMLRLVRSLSDKLYLKNTSNKITKEWIDNADIVFDRIMLMLYSDEKTVSMYITLTNTMGRYIFIKYYNKFIEVMEKEKVVLIEQLGEERYNKYLTIKQYHEVISDKWQHRDSDRRVLKNRSIQNSVG